MVDSQFLATLNNEMKLHHNYINYIDMSNNLIKIKNIRNSEFQSFSSYAKEFITDKRTFEYKSIIISLYGALERNVEKLILETLEHTTQTTEYDELDKVLQDYHLNNSLKLISILHQKRPKFEHINVNDIICNLYECINNKRSQLNTEAFLISGGNYKHEKIIDSFKSIGMDLNFIESETEYRKLAITINNIVERRNEIAHGAEGIELLDTITLKDYISEIEHYFKILYNKINKKLLINHLQANYGKFKSIKVFNKICVIAINIKNITVNKDDEIYFSNSSKEFYNAKIIGIKDNSVDVQTIKVEDTEKTITIKLECNHPLPDKCCIYFQINKNGT